MHIDRVIWLDDVVEKLERKHNVEKSEIWELLHSKPKFRFVEKGHREGENVYAALGQTDAGRYLVAFFVFKTTNAALVISARDMTRGERKRYEKK